MLNIGVIGVGYLGQHHARIFSEIAGESGNVRLVAVVDQSKGRAEEIAAKYGCKAYQDHKDILGSVDAVSIVTPTTLHYEIALDCIRAGKHLMLEKPITTTIEEADELISESEKAGVIVQAGHLERFNPAVSAIHPFIKQPLFFESERLSPFLGRGVDVDITLDLMIHDIDIIFSLIALTSKEDTGQNSNMAAIKDMKATGANVLTERIDVAHAWLEFDNGIHAQLTASRISAEKSRKLKIYQKDSYIVLDYQSMEINRFFRKGNEIVQETINPERKEPLKEELRDFIQCIGNNQRPAVCAVQGRNALKAALQIGDMIRKGWCGNEGND